MKGIYLTGHGGLDSLEYRQDIPKPEPGPGDVLIRVAAAGVNNTDINTRVGWYSKHQGAADDASWAGSPINFPLIQGIDVCGHIESIGDHVDAQRIGERVLVEPCLQEFKGKALTTPWFLGSECNGGFAEYVVVPARHAYKIESRYSDIELASFPCSYSTAENLLTRANVQEEERVLITGASGGVGSAAVQLAKTRGAHVVAVTSRSKQQSIKAIGAHEIIFRDRPLAESLELNSIDAVIDLVGGDQWSQLLEVLKPGGRYAVSGAIAGPMVELDLRTLYLKDLSFFGCTVLGSKVFKNLIGKIESEAIKPLVAKTYPLQAIQQAQTDFLKKTHTGKLVLKIGGD